MNTGWTILGLGLVLDGMRISTPGRILLAYNRRGVLRMHCSVEYRRLRLRSSSGT